MKLSFNYPNKKVFFSRSAKDFGSDYEKLWETFLTEMGCQIIQFSKKIPNRPLYGEVLYYWEKELFFPLIDDCDFLFAIPAYNVKYKKYRGKFSAGCVIEIAYALKIGKDVFGVVFGNGGGNEIGNGGGNVVELNLEHIKGYRENKNIMKSLDLLEKEK